MTTDTEGSTFPAIQDLTQEIQSMTNLVQCIIRLLEEKGILTAEEVEEAARALDAEQDADVP